MLTQCAANPRLQLDELKVAAHQFQSAVGSELLVTELDRKLLLDRLPQPPYLQPHLWGLRVVPSCVTGALQMTRQTPLFFDQIVESTRIIFGSRLETGPLAAYSSRGRRRRQVNRCLRRDPAGLTVWPGRRFRA